MKSNTVTLYTESLLSGAKGSCNEFCIVLPITVDYFITYCYAKGNELISHENKKQKLQKQRS